MLCERDDSAVVCRGIRNTEIDEGIRNHRVLIVDTRHLTGTRLHPSLVENNSVETVRGISPLPQDHADLPGINAMV